MRETGAIRSPRRRLRSLLRSGLCAPVVAVLAAGCGASGGGKTEKLSFQSQLTSESNLRVSPTTSLGSQLVFMDMIYQPTGTAAIGRDQGACTRVAPGNGVVYECLITFILPAGEIYAEAASSHDGPSTGVVTGGTSSYRAVRGTFAFTATGSPRVDLAFDLTM
jgi:hypothetical protein